MATSNTKHKSQLSLGGFAIDVREPKGPSYIFGNIFLLHTQHTIQPGGGLLLATLCHSWYEPQTAAVSNAELGLPVAVLVLEVNFVLLAVGGRLLF